MAIQAPMHRENLGVYRPQDLVVDNNCGLNDFYLNLQQQQQHHDHPSMQFQQFQNKADCNQDLRFIDRILSPKDRPMVFLQQSHIDNQSKSKEIDMLINLQNQRLRWALREQRKQQIALLLKNCESKAQFLLQKKDEEIAQAINRTTELEDLVRRMETENQTWRKVAKENEATIVSLKNSIETALAGTGAGGNGVEDAESCCEISMKSDGVMCKICNFRTSCVILLPCRHLCSCNVCEPFVESCPLCNMVKKTSLEAFF